MSHRLRTRCQQWCGPVTSAASSRGEGDGLAGAVVRQAAFNSRLASAWESIVLNSSLPRASRALSAAEHYPFYDGVRRHPYRRASMRLEGYVEWENKPPMIPSVSCAAARSVSCGGGRDAHRRVSQDYYSTTRSSLRTASRLEDINSIGRVHKTRGALLTWREGSSGSLGRILRQMRAELR